MLDETEQTDAALFLNLDGWSNALSGIGGAKDKRTAGHFSYAPILAWKELQELFAGDDLARRIIMKPAGDMLREWFELQDPDLDKPVQSEFKRRKFGALVLSRGWGGAAELSKLEAFTPKPLPEEVNTPSTGSLDLERRTINPTVYRQRSLSAEILMIATGCFMFYKT